MDAEIVLAIFEGAVKALSKKNEYFTQGNRNNYVYRLACICNRYGVPQDDFLRIASITFQETTYTIAEIRSSTISAYTKNQLEHAKYTWK